MNRDFQHRKRNYKEPNTNSGVEIYNENMNIWIRRIQQQIWDDRQKNQWTWKEIKRNYSNWKIEGKIEEKWTEPQSTSIYIMGVSEGEKRGADNIFNEIIEKLPKVDEIH